MKHTAIGYTRRYVVTHVYYRIVLCIKRSAAIKLLHPGEDFAVELEEGRIGLTDEGINWWLNNYEPLWIEQNNNNEWLGGCYEVVKSVKATP